MPAKRGAGRGKPGGALGKGQATFVGRIDRLSGAGRLGSPWQAGVSGNDADAEFTVLKRRIDAQTVQINVLKRTLADQEANLDDMRRALGSATLSTQRGTGAGTGGAAGRPSTQAVAQAQPQVPAVAGQAPAAAGQPQAQPGSPPAVAPIFEQPGILTPRGKYVLEPSLQYAYSSSNRVALVGYTVIPAILIGLIDIREVRRTTLTASLTGRMGYQPLRTRSQGAVRLPLGHQRRTRIPAGRGDRLDGLRCSGRGWATSR